MARHLFSGVAELVGGIFRAGISTLVNTANRIRVIEKPGADYAPPAHTDGTGQCWCCPDTYYDEEDQTLTVIHRRFDN